MRPLDDNEARLLAKILRTVNGANPLVAQISAVQVADESVPTLLKLIAPGSPKADGFRDGPLPGSFPVIQDGELVGEILVWVKDGRLSGIEYAWVTDNAPTGLPNPDDVEVAS